jgi:hypothetical protein
MLVAEESRNPSREVIDTSWAQVNLMGAWIDEAQKFILDAEGLEQEEVDASAVAMSEAGLFKLPFPLCYTEIKVDLIDRDHDILRSNIAIVSSSSFQVFDPLTGLDIASSVILNAPRQDGKHQFHWLPGCILHGAHKKAEFKSIPGVGVMEELVTPLAKTISDAVKTLIVLLQTKGAEKEFVPTEKINLISRDQPVNGYTIVRNYKSRDSSGRQIEERKRVRLHLRRGHVRTQHWGRNNKYTKKIWIEPTLVGYEEEGKIEHLYEVDKA